MKLPIVTAATLVFMCCACASEPPSLRFGGDQIGVPPLSLAESMTRGMPVTDALRFGAKVPQFANGAESLPPSLALVPRTAPDLRQLEAARRQSSPRVSVASGMPIIEPRENVDYKLKIVAPDPSTDFKLVIRDPGTAPEAGERK